MDNDSKLSYTSPEGLAVGEQLVFNFIYGETLTGPNHILVTATEMTKMFEIPKLFQNYINKIINSVVGTTFVDRRRYTVNGEIIILH